MIAPQLEISQYHGDARMSSWELTAALSPRGKVRVAARDVSNTILNQYSSLRPIDKGAPTTTWAMLLADDDHQFHFLACDFDAKTPGADKQAARDAAAAVAMFAKAGMNSVMCESGPSGGRHVWLAFDEPVDPDTVGTLAYALQRRFLSLDIGPLTNPSAGCVRPPGAPHRDGGYSRVVSGDLSELLHPSSTPAQVWSLVEQLSAEVIEKHETKRRTDAAPLDHKGNPYLPGIKRPLSPLSMTALETSFEPDVDASAVLWRILLGAAAAHWSYDDVLCLVSRPGMEHVRTQRNGSRRVPRPKRGSASPEAILHRQWLRAVNRTATLPRGTSDDPTFDRRAGDITALIRSVQTRADAAQGRWTRPGGPADRRILDAVSVLCLQAVTGTVEADIRRLALMTGLGRETARTALWRLAEDGWISRVREAVGVRAAMWKIAGNDVINKGVSPARPQVRPRPARANAAERILLMENLAERIQAANHDAFTPGGLGLLAGNVWARLSSSPQPLHELARRTGISSDVLRDTLAELEHARLALPSQDRWARTATDNRDRAANQMAVAGALERRRHQYGVERAVWAWWQAELDWRHTPRFQKPKKRRSPAQMVLNIVNVHAKEWPQFPCRPNGRADWKQANYYTQAA